MNKMKKPKSLRPPMPIVTPSTTAAANQESERQFELELCWCIHSLENALNSGKLSQKVAEDTVKNLKILKGNTAPLIKKRQVMKASMGDYRAKMKEEEKKMAIGPKQIKFTAAPADAGKKSNFVKKSAILSSGKDFKFNFTNLAADKDTNGNDEEVQMATISPQSDLSATSNFNAKKLNLTSNGPSFTFNFEIDEVNDQINFDGLTIKN